MQAEPQAEHRWLGKLVGEWTYETEASMGEGKAVKFSGTESGRTLAGVWVIVEGRGMAPGGGEMSTMMTLGYDVTKKRFVGSWVGSMMTHFWSYDGALSEDGTTLTLEAEGPSMADDGTMATYRDAIEFKGDDHRFLHASVLEKSGEWRHFMTTELRRKAP